MSHPFQIGDRVILTDEWKAPLLGFHAGATRTGTVRYIGPKTGLIHVHQDWNGAIIPWGASYWILLSHPHQDVAATPSLNSSVEASTSSPLLPSAIASALGRRGGLKGGPARAAKLTAEQRRQAARHAAIIRWRKHHST